MVEGTKFQRQGLGMVASNGLLGFGKFHIGPKIEGNQTRI